LCSRYQYIREDAAQEKKSYADKFGSKVSFILCFGWGSGVLF
jgi:hypothetical protein